MPVNHENDASRNQTDECGHAAVLGELTVLDVEHQDSFTSADAGSGNDQSNYRLTEATSHGLVAEITERTREPENCRFGSRERINDISSGS